MSLRQDDLAVLSRALGEGLLSVEQFTSFRGFTWCPLGSLHKRLRAFDQGMVFQQSVEYLIANGAAEVKEYPNPMSDFFTKGISLIIGAKICQQILSERDQFVRLRTLANRLDRLGASTIS